MGVTAVQMLPESPDFSTLQFARRTEADGHMCYIPYQELQGTPQEVKYQTPSDLPTNISLFHLLYYLILSSHLGCCFHYYIPVHHLLRQKR